MSGLGTSNASLTCDTEMEERHHPIEQPLTFNDALKASGIDLRQVLLFRHRPYEPALNRVFEWIAAERPDLYDCYQSTHAARVEAALVRSKFVASFIRHRGGSAIFVGVHETRSYRTYSVEQCHARPAHREFMLRPWGWSELRRQTRERI